MPFISSDLGNEAEVGIWMGEDQGTLSFALKTPWGPPEVGHDDLMGTFHQQHDNEQGSVCASEEKTKATFLYPVYRAGVSVEAN